MNASIRYGAHTFERKASVLVRAGISKTQLWRLVKAGTFPAPVKLGPMTTAWVSSEVDDWIEARIAERDAQGEAA